MNILLVGSQGKMATKIKEIAEQNKATIIAEIDKNFCSTFRCKKLASNDDNLKTSNRKTDIKKSHKYQYKKFCEIPSNIIKKIDVVLDFSNPEILKDELMFCSQNKLPLALCTTGQNRASFDLVNEYAKTVPIFMSSNTSFGINLVCNILKNFCQYFDSYDIDIVEYHHKNKIDCPSGTATELAKILHNYSPHIHSIRAGDIVGKHDILLSSQYDQITISHQAFDRKLFAKGALDICHFLNRDIPPKLYTMNDIFNN